MARDLFHEAVKTALIKEGWTITDDPYALTTVTKRRLSIDLGAERLLAAQKDTERIAVEVKSFLNPSPMYDFHQAVGQYMNYKNLLQNDELTRLLFVAVPLDAYESFFVEEDIWALVEAFSMPLIVYNPIEQEIHKWFLF